MSPLNAYLNSFYHAEMEKLRKINAARDKKQDSLLIDYGVPGKYGPALDRLLFPDSFSAIEMDPETNKETDQEPHSEEEEEEEGEEEEAEEMTSETEVNPDSEVKYASESEIVSDNAPEVDPGVEIESNLKRSLSKTIQQKRT